MLTTEVALMSILTIQLLVVCLSCDIYILFTKIFFFFFSTCGYSWELLQHELCSFGYLSSHRIQGPAHSENTGHFCMSDKWKQSFFYKMQHSITVVHKEWEHDYFNLIPSLNGFREECLALWPHHKAHTSFLHLHVSAELFTTQNMGEKWKFKFRESTGKLGLNLYLSIGVRKYGQRSHTWFFRCTAKNLVTYASIWSLTLSADFLPLIPWYFVCSSVPPCSFLFKFLFYFMIEWAVNK